MTAPAPRERLLGTVMFANNAYGVDLIGNTTFPLLHYEWLILRLSGSITVSGGTTNGTIGAEAPMSLVKSFQIVVSGLSGDEFINIPLHDLMVLTHYIGRRPRLAPKFAAPTAGVGTNTFYAEIYLPFALEDMSNPYRGFWASNRYSQVRIRVLWGTIDDIISGGDRAEAVDATTKIDIWGREYSNQLPFATQNDLLLHQRVVQKEVAINVTQGEFPIEITRTASFLRGILLKQVTIVGGVETPSSAMITGEADVIFMTDDSDRKFEYTWNQLIRQNYETYRGDLPTVGGLPYYAFLDFSPRGDFSLLLNMMQYSAMKLKIDVTNTANGFLRLIPVKYALSL